MVNSPFLENFAKCQVRGMTARLQDANRKNLYSLDEALYLLSSTTSSAVQGNAAKNTLAVRHSRPVEGIPVL